MFYVNDGNGFLVSPTLMPLKSSEGSHSARHGFGYSVFAREARQLRLELLQLAPLADAVKISRLRLTNTGATARNVTVTFYVEWVLGVTRASSAPFVTTEMDAETSAMFARNRWNLQTGNDVAFADISGRQTAWTADRREFLGTNGTLASPQALATGYTLSNRTGAGLDPCCALQTSVSLKPGQTADVVFLLGAAANATDARELIARSRTLSPDAVLADVTRYWDETLNAVQVRTPDRSLDIMLNGWLLYQTLACRMWARSGFYQASGAYGFRDQLQDSMALLTTRPAIAREHILRAAARQFIEGDVQHWWLPATGMGVRTRISDDTAWLGYCVCQYITVTGDQAILDETVPFLEGQTVAPGDHDAFFQPVQSAENASLYEHCARAIERNLPGGSHGLPLIGTGDWNDGMNRVGEDGKGESVWLGWFLYAVLQVLIPIASQRGDTARVALWGEKSISLKAALEQHGWDGAWYRRGFYDDGAPLGSAGNPECRIDAIAQSWAVISGAAAPDRALAAMEQSWHQLVRPQDKLMALFTPPFDRSPRDPGYIKAYPPGIRENGGQYTHGVLWSIFAHARLGEAERAFQLFSLLNPINHAKTPEGVQIYRVEPYVIAADVYSTEPHTGRGGWTWYTGSGAWMYRAGLEAILGITRKGNRLRIKPCIPAEWSEYEVAVQFGATRYDILISRTAKADTLMPEVQYLSPEEFAIDLKDSGGARRIVLTLGSGKRNQRAA